MFSLKDSIRSVLIRLTRLLLAARARRVLPGPAVRVVVIAPHPDDETLGCGGWLASCCANRVEVHVVVLTDGSASHPGHPVLTPNLLARQRRSECLEACRELGLPEDRVEFWGLPDGQLDRLDPPLRQEALDRLRRTAREHGGLWLVPGWRDGSTEHTGARVLVSDALRDCPEPPQIWEYFIWGWRNPLGLWSLLGHGGWMQHHAPDGPAASKSRAILSYKSQTTPTPPWSGPVLEPVLLRALEGPREFFLESNP